MSTEATITGAGTSTQAAPSIFAPVQVTQERRGDGSVLIRSGIELGEIKKSLAHLVREHAQQHPSRTLAARKSGDEWIGISWGEADRKAQGIAEALLQLGLSGDRPLMVLSGNGLEHLLLTLAAYNAGIPIIPISTAYSLASGQPTRLEMIAGLTRPGLVFADDGDAFGPALESLAATIPVLAVSSGGPSGALSFETLATTQAGPAARSAFDQVGPDTVGKILFTSGSTGIPKGVINTQRMMCANVQQLAQVWPFLQAEPPVIVDWLPWSHTFGGNQNMNQVLAFGGTEYIDDGRPTPEAFERSVDVLREIAPNAYHNVPVAYGLLTPRLEADDEFARHFFAHLRLIYYAAAPLPQSIWDRLNALVARHANHPIPLTTTWGSTEMAPSATSAHFTPARWGNIGVPMPGVTIKLAPDGDKYEARVRGPNIMPCYFENSKATEEAFDDEGFFRSGDAVLLVDPDDPAQGLMFDGRLAEDFKLITATWVRVGKLRTNLVSAAGILSDAVICGQGAAYVGALAWLNETEARRLVAHDGEVQPTDPVVRAHLADALSKMNHGRGSAQRIARLLLLAERPDVDTGELTDKGYINQRRVLERRAPDVVRLFADPPEAAVITPSPPDKETAIDTLGAGHELRPKQ